MHLQNYFQTIHWTLIQKFCRSNWFRRGMWGCNNLPLSIGELSKSSEFYYLEPLTLQSRILLKHWTPSIKSETILLKTVAQVRGVEEQKEQIYLANERCGLALFSTELHHSNFGSNIGKEFGVMFTEKGPQKNRICRWPWSHTLSHDFHRSDWVQHCWRHKGSSVAWFSPLIRN